MGTSRNKSVCIATGLLISTLFLFYLVNSYATTQPKSIPGPSAGRNTITSSSEMDATESDDVRIQIANAPAYFIKNTGQTAKEVRYYFKGNDTVYFTDKAVVFQKTQRTPPDQRVDADNDPLPHHILDVDAPREMSRSLSYKLEFIGANPTSPQARNRQKGKVAYFKGNDRSKWHTDIPTYREIVYPGLYSGNSTSVQNSSSRGNETTRAISSQDSFSISEKSKACAIDLVYKGVPGGMKYEFVVNPGADPRVIKLAYTGIEGLSIDDAGNLIIKTALGDVKDTKPYCYQEIDGKRVEVESSFKILNFGTQEDTIVQTNPIAGDTILCALNERPEVRKAEVRTDQKTETLDSPAHARMERSVMQTVHHGEKPENLEPKYIYSFKLAPYKKEYPLIIDPGLEYSTFLGGSGDDRGNDIAVDGSGNVYVTGSTWDYNIDFPTTLGAYDETYNGSTDVFVSKLTLSGNGSSDLLYSTFLGGGSAIGNGIAVDGSGNAYVTGYVNTPGTIFPTTTGAYDETHNGSSDAFVTKLSPSGAGASDLLYSTFLGGGGEDEGYGIDVDGQGNVYVIGYTQKHATAFPTTTGAYGETHNCSLDVCLDVFVAKLNPSGTGASDLLYSTFLGGSGFDLGYGITVDGSGNVYVTGETIDSTVDFPTTPGAYDETHSVSFNDIFVAKLTPSGTGASDLIYSTFLGGGRGRGITVDGSGNVYLTGETNGVSFPSTTGSYDETHNGSVDVFVTKLAPSGTGASDLLYSTFLGGGSGDVGYDISMDGSGDVYLTGQTDSLDFPTTPGAYDETHNAFKEVFVTKLSPSGTGASDLLYSTFLGGNSDDIGNGIAVDGSGSMYVAGSTRSFSFPTTTGAYDETFTGNNDAFVAKLSLIPFENNCSDGIDNDGDGDTDCYDSDCPGSPVTYYADTDGDGFGDPSNSTDDCTPPSGYVTDNTDNCPNIANPDQADPDNDGLGDVCDPCPKDADNDADGDGFCADVDNCPNIANPDQADTDNDGLGNVCDPCPKDADNDADGDGICADADNCPNIANPDQADTDNDGIGDVCDPCPNDADNDIDGDGVCGDVDNCPTIANPGQENNDGDSEGDVCDTDDDNDGTPDLSDAFPFDPTETTDSDSDGIGDNADNCPNVANPDQADTDNDGIGDVCDDCPNDADNDIDGDGVCGDVDNCPTIANPGQENNDGDSEGDVCDTDDDNDGTPDLSDAFPFDPTETTDSDSDGIGDNADNCPNVANPDQADTDNDGIGDVCDPCPNDADNDIDGDGVCGDVDNCPTISNPGQENNDGDSEGDVCDTDDDNDGTPDLSDAFPFDPSETTDSDSDGIGDNADNCPNVANPDQADTDNDGIGNVCDPTPNGDSDGDGIDNLSDNCPNVANSDQADTDNDGIGDVCDNCVGTPNPDQADADNDGLGDACDNTIIVEKQTNPENSPVSFDFNGDATGSIKDNEQIVVSNLLPGTYNVTEDVPADWDLSSIVCSDGNSSGDVNTMTATFQLEAGETVKCTFINTETVKPGDTPVMESPTPGSGLTASTVTFQWSAGTQENRYRLHVGTTGPGSKNILKRNNLSVTSYTVTGIPINGNTVYVRLWYRIGSNWSFIDYVYQTQGSSNQAPTAVADTATTPLDTQVSINVIANDSDPDGTVDPATVVVINGPTHGTAVPIADGTVWYTPDTGYTGQDVFKYTVNDDLGAISNEVLVTITVNPLAGDTPEMASPIPGSTLTSPTVTFQWSAGTQENLYRLHVGSRGPGSKDILKKNGLASTSHTVTGIPINGDTLYVRLWYRIGTAWSFIDYVYQTQGGGSSDTPEMVSPIPSSTLTAPTVTFKWSAGTQENLYRLHVGTTGPGSKNIVKQNGFTTTSHTVTGIPLNGNPVYVRLWYRVGANWSFIDYVYQT